MNNREEMIESIIEAEWKMFQHVHNIGGRADCQDDFKTFEIMRASQAESWSEAMLESYLDDLRAAEGSGRNLISEKYGRMMQSTSPAEYARIEHLLPALDPEAVELIEKIVKIELEWGEELMEKYPYIVQKGRPLHSNEDSMTVTSTETYLRGELATYSVKTLERYVEHIQKEQSENINGAAVTLLYMMKQYGFSSLEEADETIKSRV